MKEQSKILFPGDFIANEEVFLSGDGTFSDDGKVKSAIIGTPIEDMRRREVRVSTQMITPAHYRRGDTVIGSVEKVFENVAFIKLIPLTAGKHRFGSVSIPVVLRISEIRPGFVKSLSNEIKPGDIIRARIVDINPFSMSLSIKGRQYGVIKAFCSKCRHPLEMRGSTLVCPQCGWRERRKVAEDYRSGRLLR